MSSRGIIVGRRRFLATGIRAGVATAVAARRSFAQSDAAENPWANLAGDFGSVRPPTFALPLPVPAVKRPGRATAEGDEVELVVRTGTARPLPGRPTPVLGYDGTWPGPTLVATRGRPLSVTVKNHHDEPIIVHNHGHHVTADSDWHPLQVIKTGQSRIYRYPND